jgi:hypothetical protein
MIIFVLMLSIGLKEGFRGLSILWQKRSLLIRCLLASLVLVPLAGMVVLRIVPMDTSARIGLMTLEYFNHSCFYSSDRLKYSFDANGKIIIFGKKSSL